MKNKQKIEPCPSCRRLGSVVYYGGGLPQVGCRCGTHGPTRKTRAGAVRAWNRLSSRGAGKGEK